jgi:5,5'-dehydrodivanillate O-demethylase
MDAHGKLQFVDLEPVGPGTPVGCYLRKFWQPVFRASDLPSGRAKPIEILGEKFTIYRGEGGAAHVCAFRCAHRGTQLSLGWVEGDSLRCRYHGWRYDASGDCVEQPNEDRPFCDKVKLRAYPTREYLGLVFAYLGDGDPPPFVRYPDVDRPGVIVTDPPERLPCGFWNRLDNDHSHIPWVHRATALRKNRPDLLMIRHEHVEETRYGWRGTRGFKEKRTEEREQLGLARLTHWFMPNVRLFWAPTRAEGFQGRGLWDSKIVWTVPINDGSHAAFDVTHTPLDGDDAKAFAASRYGHQEPEAETRWDYGERILAGEMTLEDLPKEMSAYTSFEIEDYTTQVGQGPIAGRGPEMLAPTDIRIVVMRRLWLREVQALVDGQPLTEWKIPTEPLSLEGALS